MQCTAVALIALLTLMKCANNTSFESRDLDEILVEGTSFYRVIAETTGRSGYLSHNQLPTSVTVRQERCEVSYEFWLSLCKIVRSSVILLLPLCIRSFLWYYKWRNKFDMFLWSIQSSYFIIKFPTFDRKRSDSYNVHWYH